jgi:hypothetical protein
MKINIKNISEAIRVDKTITEGFIREQLKMKRDELTSSGQIKDYNMSELDSVIEKTFRTILNPLCKRYIITQTAKDVIERIKIDKVDMNIFHKIPINQTWEFLIDAHTCYRTYYDGVMLRGMRVNISKETLGYYCKYDSFAYEINHDTGETARETENVEHLKDIVDEWVRILVFIQFSDPDLAVLQAGRKYGTNMQNRVKNETPSDYIIVNSKWNTTSVRTNGFLVSSHFRLQAFGAGMKNRRLILIDEFEKNGYVRKSGKLIHNTTE